MKGSPLQRAVRSLDSRAQTAYHALANHSMGCAECRRPRTDGTIACPTGTTLLAAWSRARRAERR
jgi:hypothetical protein